VPGINVNIVDSSNKTALDVVHEQKTHKAVEIAKLIAGNFILLDSVDDADVTGSLMKRCTSVTDISMIKQVHF